MICLSIKDRHKFKAIINLINVYQWSSGTVMKCPRCGGNAEIVSRTNTISGKITLYKCNNCYKTWEKRE